MQKKRASRKQRLLRKDYYKKPGSSCQNCKCSIRDQAISEDDWKGKNLADETPAWVDTAEKLFKYKPILPFPSK